MNSRIDWRQEQGGALVWVLFLLMVLTILGFGYISLSTTETLQSFRYASRLQAYHYAKAGAEIVAERIESDPDTISAFAHGTISLLMFTDVEGDLGAGAPIEVRLVPDDVDDGIVRLRSTGRHHRTAQTVSLVMLVTENKGFHGLFDNALYSYAPIDATQTHSLIIGDAESAGSISGEVPGDIDGNVKPYSTRVYESPIMPDVSGLPNHGVLSVGNHSTDTVSDSGVYSQINVNNHGTLYIDSGGAGDELVIVVGSIDIKGKIEVQGTGTVMMFVQDGGSIRTPGSEMGVLLMVLADGSSLTVQTPGTHFHGYIYGPNAVLKNAAHSRIVGSVIVGALDSNPVWTFEYRSFPEIDTSSLEEYIGIVESIHFERARWE